MALLLNQKAQTTLFVVWLKTSNGWCASDSLTTQEADLVCHDLDNQGREYRREPRLSVSKEDILE